MKIFRPLMFLVSGLASCQAEAEPPPKADPPLNTTVLSESACPTNTTILKNLPYKFNLIPVDTARSRNYHGVVLGDVANAGSNLKSVQFFADLSSIRQSSRFSLADGGYLHTYKDSVIATTECYLYNFGTQSQMPGCWVRSDKHYGKINLPEQNSLLGSIHEQNII